MQAQGPVSTRFSRHSSRLVAQPTLTKQVMQAQGPVSTRFSRHSSRLVAQPTLTVQLPAIPQNNLYMLWGLAAREGTIEELTIQSGVWLPGKASGMLWGLAAREASNLPSCFCALQYRGSAPDLKLSAPHSPHGARQSIHYVYTVGTRC